MSPLILLQKSEPTHVGCYEQRDFQPARNEIRGIKSRPSCAAIGREFFLRRYRLRRFPKRHRFVSVPSLTELEKCVLMAAQQSKEIIVPRLAQGAGVRYTPAPFYCRKKKASCRAGQADAAPRRWTLNFSPSTTYPPPSAFSESSPACFRPAFDGIGGSWFTPRRRFT